MKHRIQHAFLALLVALITTSCVTDVDYNQGENIVDLALSALATPDTAFYVQLTYVRGVNYSGGNSSFCSIAKVNLSVNDEDLGLMTIDSSSNSFVSDYMPAPGDKIDVNVTSTAYNTNFSASTTVPQLVDYEVVDVSFGSMESAVSNLTDSVLTVKLKFTDPKESNYYRLSVRNVRSSNIHGLYSSETDFIASAIAALPGATDQYTPIFTDETFNGDEIEITVNSWIADVNNTWASYPIYDDDGNAVSQYVVIILENITQDYYNYLQSTYAYLASDNTSTMSQAVTIYSNCSNDVGILAASTPAYHVIPY